MSERFVNDFSGSSKNKIPDNAFPFPFPIHAFSFPHSCLSIPQFHHCFNLFNFLLDFFFLVSLIYFSSLLLLFLYSSFPLSFSFFILSSIPMNDTDQGRRSASSLHIHESSSTSIHSILNFNLNGLSPPCFFPN